MNGRSRPVAYNQAMQRPGLTIFSLAAMVSVAQLLCATAEAQDPPSPEPPAVSEFNRASGGQIEMITKESKRLSGTLGMTLSSANSSFSAGKPRKGYEATFGGSLVEDRIWFFAAAQRQDALQFASAFPRMPETASATEGKVIAELGDHHHLAASLGAGAELPAGGSWAIPSSFLSLNYTGIISSNMFFTASVSRHSTTQPAFAGFGQSQ